MKTFFQSLCGLFLALTLFAAISGAGAEADTSRPSPTGQAVFGAAAVGRMATAPLPGMTQPSDRTIQGNFDALAQAFLSRDQVEIIVTLRQADEIAALDLGVEPLLETAMAYNDALNQQTLSRLGAHEFELQRQYRSIAGFAGRVTFDGLVKLLEDNNVASITLNQTVQAHTRQGLPLMGALAHRAQYGGKGVAIAILDTGVDYNHPLLGNGGFPNSKVLGGYNHGDNDPDPFPRGGAHGTACAGIAAGDVRETGDYIGGVAPDAKLYALKISIDDTDGSDYAIIVDAIDWCVRNKNRAPNHPLLVISISFGGGMFTSAQQCAAEYPAMSAIARAARNAGITIFASSGNDYFCDAMSAPACLPDVISVGAVYDARMGAFPHCVTMESCIEGEPNPYCWDFPLYVSQNSAPDAVIAYSNTAPFLDLLAPSEKAYTLDITGTAGYSTDGFVRDFNGTSAACPYAAGAAAVLQSAAFETLGRYLTPDEIRSRLVSTGRMIQDTKVPIAKPRVDLKAALETIITVPPPPPGPGPTPWSAYYDIRYYRNGRLDRPSISVTAEGIFVRPGANDRDQLIIRTTYRDPENLPPIPAIHSPAGFQRVHLEGPVAMLRADGPIRQLVTRRGHVGYLSAPQLGRVAMMNLTRSGTRNRLISTTIDATPDDEDWEYTGAPLNVSLVGVSLAGLQAPAQRATITLASRAWQTPDGVRDVSKSHLPMVSGRNVVAGDLARLTVHGGGIHATQVVSLSGRTMQVAARGGMFTLGEPGGRYQVWYPGDVSPGTLESGADQLSVQALGGDIRAGAIWADQDIAQVRSTTRRLPWRQWIDQQVYAEFSGGYIICNNIVAGREPGSANIGAIHADWGLNWAFQPSGGAVIAYRQNRIQAGADCRGTVGLISSRFPAQTGQPYGVQRGEGPYLCGTVYAAAPPRVQGGHSEGYLLWSNVCN